MAIIKCKRLLVETKFVLGGSFTMSLVATYTKLYILAHFFLGEEHFLIDVNVLENRLQRGLLKRAHFCEIIDLV